MGHAEYQPEDAIKLQMFGDIGLDDWHIKDIGAVSGRDIGRRLALTARNQDASRVRLGTAMALVERLQRRGMMQSGARSDFPTCR